MSEYIIRRTACDECSPVSRNVQAFGTVSVVDPKGSGDEQVIKTLCVQCAAEFKRDREDEGHTVEFA